MKTAVYKAPTFPNIGLVPVKKVCICREIKYITCTLCHSQVNLVTAEKLYAVFSYSNNII